MIMIINRSHFLNVLFWVLLIAFMWVKSLQHTVDVHFEGVQSAIRQYQIPADARMYLLKQLVDYPKLASMDLELKKKITMIRQSNNMVEFVVSNHHTTLFVDKFYREFTYVYHIDKGLTDLQQQLHQEALVYNAHANVFNALVDRFPYSLFSSSYVPFATLDVDHSKGLIVER